VRYNDFELRDDIRLGELDEWHAPKMYRWMCDPEVAGNIGLTTEPTLEKTLAWIAAQKSDPSIRAFAILAGDRHLGNVVLDRIERYHGKARFSIYVGEAADRGSGVGTTSGYLALEHAFHDLDLAKVWLTVHSKHGRGLRTYTRLGFVQEGVLRDEFVLDGERLPLIYMGLLRAEFQARKEGA
jgi:RimJ/RimL family protein N-acetyltransferase